VKDCILLPLKAWASVSEATIVNCWDSRDILNNKLEQQLNSFMNIDMSDIEACVDEKLIYFILLETKLSF